MKILFDCIVTSTPSRCSTTIQFSTLAKRLLGHPNTYIYWPIPDFLTDEEKDWYPQSDRIEYIEVPQVKDRMKEYMRVSPQLEGLLAFNGSHWDWDVCVTVRSLMVPLMKMLAIRPGTNARAWTKRIYLIENMMVMSFKPTVAQTAIDIQDRACLEAYLAADRVLLPAYHQKSLAVKVAKNYFTPSTVKAIASNIQEVCQLDLPEFILKKERFRYAGQRKFNIAFIGRMEKTAARLPMINDVFTNQFIMAGGEVTSNVCTVSSVSKVFDKDITDVKHPDRQEFWRLCKEELDLSIVATVDVELNLSTLEPVAFGVPMLVKKAAWSVAMFGDDYPFYFSSMTQAYWWVSEFRKDYAKHYKTFSCWFELWFKPTYLYRITEQGLYNTLEALVFGSSMTSEQVKSIAVLKQNEIVKLLNIKGGAEFIVFDQLHKIAKTDLHGLQVKLKPDARETRSLVFSTQWNDFRIGLKQYYGYEDGSVVVGHLKKGV